MTAYVLRKLGPPILLTGVYTLVAALVLRWDQAKLGASLPDFGATLYAMYTQLFFEPTEPFPASPVSRAVFWVTPVLGTVLVAQGVVKVGASLFEPGARRRLWVSIVSGQMRGHVVLCGLGHVGIRVLEELQRLGEDVVAIESREEGAFLDEARALGVPVHVGDARRDDFLKACNVEHAKAIVCATNNDLANLEIALDAKRMNPKIRVVMRMFDQRLAKKAGGALGLDASFSTSAVAAPVIALQATQEGVLSAYRLEDVVRLTAEVRLPSGAPVREVSELEADLPCRIVGRIRGAGRVFSAVRPSDEVSGGDVLVVDVAAVDLASVRYRLGA